MRSIHGLIALAAGLVFALISNKWYFSSSSCKPPPFHPRPKKKRIANTVQANTLQNSEGISRDSEIPRRSKYLSLFPQTEYWMNRTALLFCHLPIKGVPNIVLDYLIQSLVQFYEASDEDIVTEGKIMTTKGYLLQTLHFDYKPDGWAVLVGKHSLTQIVERWTMTFDTGDDVHECAKAVFGLTTLPAVQSFIGGRYHNAMDILSSVETTLDGCGIYTNSPGTLYYGAEEILTDEALEEKWGIFGIPGSTVTVIAVPNFKDGCYQISFEITTPGSKKLSIMKDVYHIPFTYASEYYPVFVTCKRVRLLVSSSPQ
jgi:hypothetical protein